LKVNFKVAFPPNGPPEFLESVFKNWGS